MDINKYLLTYFFFSVLGWLWESVYCTAKERKWQNRGFLFGPLCPIYGFGSIIGLVYSDLNTLGIIDPLPWWKIFIAGFLISMILEYPTSYILEKRFHARWWDYSNLPFNIGGRTSLITSMGFGIGAIVIVNYLIPFFEQALLIFPDLFIAVLSVLLVAIHSADFTLTVSHLTNFQRNIDEIERNFQNIMTKKVDDIFEKQSHLYGRTLERIVSFKMSKAHNMVAKKFIQALRDAKRMK